MAVYIYNNNQPKLLAGAKVFTVNQWETLPALAQIYISPSWQYLGTVISGQIVNSYITVAAGSAYLDTQINSGGLLYVSSGGAVDNTTVNPGGRLNVYSSSPATGIVENGGYVYVAEGADVTFTPNTFSGITLDYQQFATVHSGTTAVSTTLNSQNATLNIFSGGTTTGVKVSSGGRLQVNNGGTANSNTVNSYGNMYVSSGGKTDYTTVNSGGYLIVASGGTARAVISRAGANIVSHIGGHIEYVSGEVLIYKTSTLISSAAILIDKTLDSHYEMHVRAAGQASNIIVDSHGFLYVSSGGYVNNTVINSNGTARIFSGGTATSITVNEEARIWLTVAPDTYIQGTYAGSAFLIENAFVSDYTVNSGVSLAVCSGGTVSSTTVNRGGKVYVSSGGIINSIIIDNSGGVITSLHVSSGGTATNIIWTPCGGDVDIEDGGYATFASSYSGVYLGYGDSLHSTATSTTNIIMDIRSYNRMYIFSGGTANNTSIVYTANSVYVSDGGVASNTFISGNCGMTVRSGGTALDTKNSHAGKLYVMKGGMVSGATAFTDGTISIGSGASYYAGTIINSGGSINIHNNAIAL